MGGIGWISFLCVIPLIMLFRKRSLGLLDPLNIFLITRSSPMLAAAIILFIQFQLTYLTIVFIISGISFLVSLYFCTPKSKAIKLDSRSLPIKYLLSLSVILVFLKTFILYQATGGIPLFSEGGSNAYIAFDVNNKLGSSFLLGMGAAELTLLAFIIPLLKTTRSRFFVIIILIYAIGIGLLGGKKSGLLSLSIAIALGEYLRLFFVANQKVFFLKLKFLLLGSVGIIGWGGYIFTKTEATEFSNIDLTTVSFVLDFIMFQWAYPFFLFVSGELNQFFISYEANEFTYFFHSLLSPLGAPAFEMSVGPSINEFLTGTATGNGINPSFIIEGYVLVGLFLPLYAILAGIFIGKLRALLMRLAPFEFKIALIAFLLPASYTFAIDGLLFFKTLYVIIFLFIFILVPLRMLFLNYRLSNG